MKQHANILPGHPAPGLKVQTTSGKTWDLSQRQPENFTLLIFYRGQHCPICKKTLEELNKKIGTLNKKGVEVLAVSMDSQKRAEKSFADWDIKDVTLGYGLSAETALKWGLYLSDSIKDGEPRIFSEPGLFIIQPDGTLYAASIQTMPFARPGLEDVISAFDYIIKNDYPARGTLGYDDYRKVA